MESFIVSKRVTINAGPEAVWEALTNPELTKKYFFNCKVFSTWKVGDPISFRGRIFLVKKIELNGKILKIEPLKLLQYTLVNNSDVGVSVSTVTDELRAKNGETILTITDDVGGGERAAKRYERSKKGWDKVLRGLKDLVESKVAA